MSPMWYCSFLIYCLNDNCYASEVILLFKNHLRGQLTGIFIIIKLFELYRGMSSFLILWNQFSFLNSLYLSRQYLVKCNGIHYVLLNEWNETKVLINIFIDLSRRFGFVKNHFQDKGI